MARTMKKEMKTKSLFFDEDKNIYLTALGTGLVAGGAVGTGLFFTGTTVFSAVGVVSAVVMTATGFGAIAAVAVGLVALGVMFVMKHYKKSGFYIKPNIRHQPVYPELNFFTEDGVGIVKSSELISRATVLSDVRFFNEEAKTEIKGSVTDANATYEYTVYRVNVEGVSDPQGGLLKYVFDDKDGCVLETLKVEGAFKDPLSSSEQRFADMENMEISVWQEIHGEENEGKPDEDQESNFGLD